MTPYYLSYYLSFTNFLTEIQICNTKCICNLYYLFSELSSKFTFVDTLLYLILVGAQELPGNRSSRSLSKFQHSSEFLFLQ